MESGLNMWHNRILLLVVFAVSLTSCMATAIFFIVGKPVSALFAGLCAFMFLKTYRECTRR